MTDIIRRKLDQAKKQLAEMERQANRPAPVERKPVVLCRLFRKMLKNVLLRQS